MKSTGENSSDCSIRDRLQTTQWEGSFRWLCNYRCISMSIQFVYNKGVLSRRVVISKNHQSSFSSVTKCTGSGFPGKFTIDHPSRKYHVTSTCQLNGSAKVYGTLNATHTSCHHAILPFSKSYFQKSSQLLFEYRKYRFVGPNTRLSLVVPQT